MVASGLNPARFAGAIAGNAASSGTSIRTLPASGATRKPAIPASEALYVFNLSRTFWLPTSPGGGEPFALLGMDMSAGEHCPFAKTPVATSKVAQAGISLSGVRLPVENIPPSHPSMTFIQFRARGVEPAPAASAAIARCNR